MRGVVDTEERNVWEINGYRNMGPWSIRKTRSKKRVHCQEGAEVKKK